LTIAGVSWRPPASGAAVPADTLRSAGGRRPRGHHALASLAGGAGVALLLVCAAGVTAVARAQAATGEETRVVIESDGWRLVGDLLLPASDRPVPAVLLLNKAAGDRRAYAALARALAGRGIGSLRLDLRGHGESINLGRFIPADTTNRQRMIWDSDADVVVAQRYLRAHPRIDPNRIGVVGASYSGEEMAEAGRIAGYVRAYAALSPGSFSDLSIDAIDASGVPWLVIVSKDERYLHEVASAVRERSRTAELLMVPGTGHATEILQERPDLAGRLAAWFAWALRD